MVYETRLRPTDQGRRPLDDFIKVDTQNNRGLTSRAKMAGQTVVALGYGLPATQFFADERGVRPASQRISTIHDRVIKLPLIVVLLVIWFIVTATSNGANLTDGADGLLAGTSAMIFGAYPVVNIWQNSHRCGSLQPTVVDSQCYQARDPLDLAVFATAIAAACTGFLWWNATSARIILGDVGSLAIGGAVAGIAPIHHHFEHLGWDEVTVVVSFWIIAGLCVAAGLAIFYADWLS